MDRIKLDTKNVILTLQTEEGREIKMYIPQPSKAETQRIAKILGFVFTQATNKKINLLVLAQDWELYLDDFFEDVSNPEELKNELLGFFDRKIVLGNIFYSDTGEALDKSLDEETMRLAKGFLLFFTALSRFASQSLKGKEMRDYFTSLTALEYQESLKKLSKEVKQSVRESQ